jgi:hypothetical protein
MDIPCEKCITFAMCKYSHSIVDLVKKCEILAINIQTMDDAIDSIHIIQPAYYEDCVNGGRTLDINAEAILKASHKAVFNYRRENANKKKT